MLEREKAEPNRRELTDRFIRQVNPPENVVALGRT